MLETTLQGDKGSETLYVDNMGRTLEVASRVEPQAGNDVILTIDMDLQKAAYQILEQYIAGIICAKLRIQKSSMQTSSSRLTRSGFRFMMSIMHCLRTMC